MDPDRPSFGAEWSELAVAEIGPSGAVRSINEQGRRAWGWTDGERLPNALRIGMSELDAGAAGLLPLSPGGPTLLCVRFEEIGSWLLVGPAESSADLRREGSDFKSLIEKIPVSVTVLRRDGTVAFVNAAATALTGYSPDEIEGRRFWTDAVHPEDRWKLMGALRRAVEGERAEVVVRFLSKRRGPRLVEMHLLSADVDEGRLIECVAFDVTERSEVEEALFQSEALYRIFLEQSPVGMLHLDAAGRVTFENHQFRQIIGEDVEDAWIGRSIAEIEGLDVRAGRLVESMLTRGRAFHGETASYRRPGAGSQYLQLHGSPIRHPEGGIVGGVLMVEDRTEERRRKDELDMRSRYAAAESELRKAALSDQGQQPFLGAAARIVGEATGADRVCVLLSNAAGDGCSNRVRWRRTGAAEPPPLFILHAEEPALRSLVEKRGSLHVRAHEPGEAARDLLNRTGAREAIWLPFFDESRLSGLVVVERTGVGIEGAPPTWHDSERRLVEQLVRLFETLWSWMLAGSRYRRITSAIDDCLFTYTFDEDRERRYLFLTPQIERLTGHTVEQIVTEDAKRGRWSDVVVHEEDQALVDRHDELLWGGRESRVSYRIRHLDGSIRWLHEHATPDTDGMGDVIVSGILTDITEQKAAEDVLTEAKQHAESANRLKSAFVATMSHEIRTPMGAVNGFAELLTRELSELEEQGVDLPPQIIEFLHAIRDNSKRLLTLVNDLFDLSNLEVGSIELRRATVPLHEIVMRSTSKVAVPLSRKGVDLHVKLAETDPLVVGDAQRLEQVMDNLLSNAAKFTEQGSVHVRTRVADGQVVTEVKDTGVGISEAHLERLFEPFVQEDSRLNRRFEGSGLGLSLVERLLALMDGSIDVESTKGEGTTFTICLPQAGADERS